MKIKWITVFAAGALLLAACGGSDEGSSANSAVAAAAIDEMVDAGFERGDAECYVNGILSEFGIAELAALEGDGEMSPEMTVRAFELFSECNIDLGGLGGTDSGEMPTDFRELASPRAEVDGPYTYGDDADLDAMWDACEAGSGAGCDDLFFQSPFGSEYEAYGNTCGNRMELQFICSQLDD